MKRFTKLAAVFAALMLALACFVACSNGDDSSSTSTGGSASTGNSGSGGSATVLEGLWVIDEFIDNDDEKNGCYFKGNSMYTIGYAHGKYYCIEDSKMSFSVSGNKIVVVDDGETDELLFTISGNTMTIIMPDKQSCTMEKVEVIPTKITTSDFENLL